MPKRPSARHRVAPVASKPPPPKGFTGYQCGHQAILQLPLLPPAVQAITASRVRGRPPRMNLGNFPLFRDGARILDCGEGGVALWRTANPEVMPCDAGCQRPKDRLPAPTNQSRRQGKPRELAPRKISRESRNEAKQSRSSLPPYPPWRGRSRGHSRPARAMSELMEGSSSGSPPGTRGSWATSRYRSSSRRSSPAASGSSAISTGSPGRSRSASVRESPTRQSPKRGQAGRKKEGAPCSPTMTS